MALVGSINFLLGMESSKFTSGANRGIKDLNRMKAAAGGLQSVLGAIGLGVGIHQVTRFLGESIQAAEEQHKASEKLNAVLEATGHAAGFSAGELEKQASALQMLTGAADETITSAQAVLATFRRVQGDAFERGTKLALDMSRVLDVDLKTSILQVGKALNDPVLGITSLRRAGVSFTEEQKAAIKVAIEHNDVLAAQNIILGELSSEFGGAASRMRTDLDSLSVAWDELKEAIGGVAATDFGQSIIRGAEGFLGGLKSKLEGGEFDTSAAAVERAKAEISIPQNIRDEAIRAGIIKETDTEKMQRLMDETFARLSEIAPTEGEKIRRASEERRRLNPDVWGTGILEDLPAAMLGELSAAAIHAIDSSIDRTRPDGMKGMESMPEIRDRQFGGAALRGSEEAFRTIAAFQGSRAPERAEQQRERQIKSLEKIEQSVRDNAIEIEVSPIA